MNIGLKNLGNTCFMNAALQCLIHSPELLVELCKLPIHEKKHQYALTYEICKLIAKMCANQPGAVNPKEIKHLVSKEFSYITDGSQHDSHEFFLLLLQLLEEEQNKALNAERGTFPTELVLPSTVYDNAFSDATCIRTILTKAEEWWDVYKKHNPNAITDVFYGEQIASIHCTNCHHHSYVFSAFNSLYLSIPQKQYEITVNVVVESFLYSSTPENHISIQVYPVRCIFDENSILSQIEEQIISKITYGDVKGVGSLIFLKGLFEKNSGSILYSYLNKATLLRDFQNLPPQSTIVAYFVPYTIAHEDYHSFVLVNQVCLFYLQKSNIFHMNNACIPFCLIVDPEESTDSLISRLQFILHSLYNLSNITTQSSRKSSSLLSSKDQTISIQFNPSKENVFYYPFPNSLHMESADCDSWCFPFLRVLGNNTFSLKDFETAPHINLTTHQTVNHDQLKATDWLESFSSLLDPVANRTAFSISSIFRISRKIPISEDLAHSIQSYFNESNSEQIIKKIVGEVICELKVIHFQVVSHDHCLTLNDCYSFSSIADMTVPCEKCHKKSKEEIHQRFSRLPPVLVFVLKRFDYNSHTMQGMHSYSNQNKITDFVDFPLEGLDLSSYLLSSSPALYDLFCVCNHTGSSYFGHYYAYCRTFLHNSFQWMEFNDSSTISLLPEQIVTSNAYLLFYHRRDIEIPFKTQEDYRNLLLQHFPEFHDLYGEGGILRRSSKEWREMLRGFNPMRRSQSSMSLSESSHSPISRLHSTASLPSLESTMESSGIEIPKQEIEHESTSPILNSSNYQNNKKEQEDYDHQTALQLQMQFQHEDRKRSKRKFRICIFSLIISLIFVMCILFFSLVIYFGILSLK